MTNVTLAQSYLIKVEIRLKAVRLLFREKDYSDVIRESQEIVELCLKGILRFVGIEPPKFHDVGDLVIEHKDRFKGIPLRDLKKAASISKDLRKERELAFYGEIDFIPTEEYSKKDAKKAISDVEKVVKLMKKVVSFKQEKRK